MVIEATDCTDIHQPRDYAVGHDPLAWRLAYDQLCDVLVVHFGLTRESLSPAVLLDDELAMDSLDLLDLAIVLSDRAHVDLGVDVLSLAQTLGDLTSLIVAASATGTGQSGK